MYIAILAICAAAVSIPSLTARQLGEPGRRPYELLVQSGGSQGSVCSILSFRQVPIYKGLPDGTGKFVQERSCVASADNYSGSDERRLFRIFSYDEETARSQARLLCGAAPDRASEVPSPSMSPAMTTSRTAQHLFSTEHDVLDTFDTTIDATTSPPLRIEPLVLSGPSHNRVDLVFFSDGYTPEEYGKFMDDAARLAKDVSSNQTFHTVKPLINFWAAFSPSNESGIGVGGKPKDTPFGLYRDGTELRGVYYSRPEAARAACSSMGDRCDYPILLGNDPLYGGLGGEFTVITSSLANGPLVLRHELGHSIINVGEEYDGGYAYFGVNAAEGLSSPIPWAHWLNDSAQCDPPRVERSVMPLQEYPWTLLNTSTPWSTSFNSSGVYSRHLQRFSVSGIPSERDLRVEADGSNLGWTPRQDIGVDRWHYDIYSDEAFSEGSHELKFTLLNKDLEGQAQLCSVESLEFGDETEFVATRGYYSLFPTFSDKNETSYRPTNEDCLMRVVTSPNFCKVCGEGLWLSLLRRVELIDDVREGCEWHEASDFSINEDSGNDSSGSKGKWKRTVKISLVPLAEFRDEGVDVAESYEITWTKDGKVLGAFTNKTVLEVDDEDGVGTFGIDVKFSTEEVRVDTDGLLTSGGEYTVLRRCAEGIST